MTPTDTIQALSGSPELPNKTPLHVSLATFIRSLFKIWWLFVIIALVAGLVGYLTARFQKVNYESSLTFALDEGGSGSEGGGLMSIAAQFGLSMGTSNSVFNGDNIITILTSRRIIEKVLLSVDTFDNKPQTLIGFYLEKIDKSEHREGVKEVSFPPGQERSTFSKEQDSVLYKTYIEFEKYDLVVWKPDRYLNIYQVKMVSPNEDFTAIFTNRLISEASSFYTDMRSKKAKETVRILEERVAQMKGSLNSSISNKASVQDANVNPAFAEAQVPVLKNQTNIQVYGAAYGEMFKNLEIARYQYLKDIPLLQIIDRAEYPMKVIRPSKLIYAIIYSSLAVFAAVIVFWLIRIIKD